MVLAELISAVGLEPWDFVVTSMLWALYQLYWPSWLHPQEPRFRKMINGRFEELEKRVEDTRRSNKVVAQVVRALAAAESKIDDERVDEYVVENGVDPKEKFLKESVYDDKYPGDRPSDDD